MFIGVIFDSANAVNQRLLQAEMKFSIPYVLNSLQALLTTLLLGYLVVTGNTSIELIAGARTAGICIAFLAGLAVAGRMGFPFRFRLRHPAFGSFVRNSITMSFGQNIRNFLINPITNNILALLPTGYASYFYYAQRLHTISNHVVIGPSYTVLNSRVSMHWAGKNLRGNQGGYKEVPAACRVDLYDYHNLRRAADPFRLSHDRIEKPVAAGYPVHSAPVPGVGALVPDQSD